MNKQEFIQTLQEELYNTRDQLESAEATGSDQQMIAALFSKCKTLINVIRLAKYLDDNNYSEDNTEPLIRLFHD